MNDMVDKYSHLYDKIFAGDLTEELEDEGNKLHGGPFASTDLGVSAMDKMKIVYSHKGD